MSLPLDYHPSHACMLERGWVLAFAHVRGGGERGKAWHAAGRGLDKWNSFRDFEVGVGRPLFMLGCSVCLAWCRKKKSVLAAGAFAHSLPAGLCVVCRVRARW